MIQMRDVVKEYEHQVLALDHITLSVDQGEFLYLVGESGAGKSTLMKLMYRELAPTSGFVMINHFDLRQMKEREVPHLRRTLGVVFQDFKLLPKLTVRENVAYALKVIEKPASEIVAAVDQVLEEVGLSDEADRFPHELSGGQQQRVAIARAVVNHPALLLADEPTGNLDPTTTWEIMELLEKINHQDTTVVMATHNREIVNERPHRVIEITHGQIVRDEEGGRYHHELEHHERSLKK